MGAAFDPEKFCRYTGKRLYLCPLESPEAVRMAYWREDGNLCRVRDMSPEEKAWIDANPDLYQANQDRFGKWLATVGNL